MKKALSSKKYLPTANFKGWQSSLERQRTTLAWTLFIAQAMVVWSVMGRGDLHTSSDLHHIVNCFKNNILEFCKSSETSTAEEWEFRAADVDKALEVRQSWFSI